MIDKLQRLAQGIQILRLPSIVVGLIGFASIIAIMFTSKSPEGDRFLIPCIVGLLWAMSTYSFIVTFRSVPAKANKSLKLLGKLKRNINRGWHWLIGLLFLGTTVAVMFVTLRMVSIWMKDYSG